MKSSPYGQNWQQKLETVDNNLEEEFCDVILSLEQENWIDNQLTENCRPKYTEFF